MRQVLIRTTGRTCQIPRAYPRSTNITALSLIGVRTKSVHERHVAPVVSALVAHFTSAPCELSCQCHHPGPRTWKPFCDEQAGSWPILSGKCFHVLGLGVRRSLFAQRTMRIVVKFA